MVSFIFLYLGHIFVTSVAVIFRAASLALETLYGFFSDIKMAPNDIYQIQGTTGEIYFYVNKQVVHIVISNIFS